MTEISKYTHGLYSVNPNPLPINQGSITRGHEFRLLKRYCKTTNRHSFLK